MKPKVPSNLISFIFVLSIPSEERTHLAGSKRTMKTIKEQDNDCLKTDPVDLSSPSEK